MATPTNPADYAELLNRLSHDEFQASFRLSERIERYTSFGHDSRELDAFRRKIEMAARSLFESEAHSSGRLSPIRILQVQRREGGHRYELLMRTEGDHDYNVAVDVSGRGGEYRLWEELARLSWERDYRGERRRAPRDMRVIFGWFDEALEDVQLVLEEQQIRRQYIDAQCSGQLSEEADFALAQQYQEAQRTLHEHREARRRNRNRNNPDWVSRQPDRSPERSTATEVLARQQHEALYRWDRYPRHIWTNDVDPAQQAAAQAERAAAQERGLKLLRENLTEVQRAEYDQYNYFHVVGGESGTRYRILHGRQINIRRLDAAGKIVEKLCFLPAGALVEGDVMLAQKLALELQESAALKVANRFPPEDPLAAYRMGMDLVRRHHASFWNVFPT